MLTEKDHQELCDTQLKFILCLPEKEALLQLQFHIHLLHRLRPTRTDADAELNFARPQPEALYPGGKDRLT